jgi:type III secretion system YopN/LcrE/InvE/MxiC family regulator
MANIPIKAPSATTPTQAQRPSKELIAQQVATNLRFTEEMEQEGVNPVASPVFQARLNRFLPISERRRILESKENAKIQEVAQKAEEDLAREFHKRNDELPIDRLLRVKRSLSNNATTEDIIDFVTSEFADATLADEVFEYLEHASSGALKERVRAAHELFNEEKQREIIAGRNVTAAAKVFHNKGLGQSPTELRELYRDVTGNIRDHNTLFKDLSDKYSFDALKMVVRFLLQGLGYDLKSKGPSIQQAELIKLMTEVRNLQSILWVYFFFKSRMKLLRALFSKHGLTLSKALTFERLAKEFIKLVEERYPTIFKLIKQMEDLNLLDSAKIIVLSQYRDAIRQLSVRVYKNHRHQQDLLVVILEALDHLEEKEEEKEEKR